MSGTGEFTCYVDPPWKKKKAFWICFLFILIRRESSRPCEQECSWQTEKFFSSRKLHLICISVSIWILKKIILFTDIYFWMNWNSNKWFPINSRIKMKWNLVDGESHLLTVFVLRTDWPLLSDFIGRNRVVNIARISSFSPFILFFVFKENRKFFLNEKFEFLWFGFHSINP